MKLLIVLPHSFELWRAPDWFARRLRQQFPEIEVVELPSYDQVDQHIGDTDIAISWSLKPEQIKAAHKLRWIHSPAAAVHLLIFPELVNSDIVLTNARDVHGPVVAEHVIGLIFALAKRIPQAVRLQQQHVWGQATLWAERPRPSEVSGATLGLVGVGSIGRNVAKLAKSLGMRVIAVREHPEKGKPDHVEEVYGPAQLDLLLERADYVVLAAPVTAESQHLISAAELAKIKTTAFLINVGRGPLVDETALVDALRRKAIAGAALDVVGKEPLSPDSPLWDLDNLLLTPHSASLTEKLWGRHYLQISENLRRFMTGHELVGVVDKKSGY